MVLNIWIQIGLYFIIFLSSLPIGYFLARLCREELVDGRKWFIIISIVSGVLLIALLFIFRNLPSLISLGYLISISLFALYKSYDNQFVNKKELKHNL